MTVIRVEERHRTEDGTFAARVSFTGGGEYDVEITDPGSESRERRLAWYFEEHLQFPFLDRDLAKDAVEQLDAYGTELFGQVFTGRCGERYRELARRAFDGCRLEVSGSAAFHRLHWEALRDPELPVPLVVRMPLARRVAAQPQGFELPPQRSTLNILVVTARPDGAKDVGYRTLSRPLLDGMRRADRPVVVDLVRPGTWPALREHLRQVSKAHGNGFYQVVHFDVHGSVAEFADLEKGRRADRFLFGSPAFEGKRAFVFFETATEGKAEPVSAADIAALLAEHRVPVVVLSACQSAKEPVSEASLAQRLVEAGVPVAVGMAYSVTVTAAEQAMPLFYEELSQGEDPMAAMLTARRSLFETKCRRGYFEQDLELEDWVLPVVFGQHPVNLGLGEMTAEQSARFFQRQALVGDEPVVEYGFVGRDLDIQVLERRLLITADRNLLLLRGMAGAGKSTLLRHVAWWWQHTGLVEHVFRFSYEDRAWTTSQIIRDIATVLLDRVEQAKLEMLPEPAQPERVAQLLRARRYLLILDNAESIAASPAAIPHALPEPERERLATFLSRLRGGRTLILIGSREAEQWLAPRTFRDNIHVLPGLDPQAASVLTERILQHHGATRHLTDTTQRDALQQLTALLGGYPLPLNVVLPSLATSTPEQILTELRAGGDSADPVGLISRAIEYSHGKLNPATQHSLLFLAPFTASIPGPALQTYQQLLNEHNAVHTLSPIDLQAAVAEVIRVGLATPHPQLQDWVHVLPVLPYFLRTRLTTHPPQLPAAANQAHYQLYTTLGTEIQRLLTSHKPQQRHLGLVIVRTEYANLTTALDHGLDTGQPILPILRALEEYVDQTKQQDTRRHLLDHAITATRPPGNAELQRELAHLHHLAGMVAQEQRRFEEAEGHYRQALTISLELGNRHNAATSYHQLGMVAQEQRRFEEAEGHYRQALTIWLEFGDRHSTASTYHQLGVVAQLQRRFEEAEGYYRQALTISLEFGDRRSTAITYHQLGMIAQEQRRFEEAEGHYQQSLTIWLEFGDRHSTASTYHQLGMVAELQRRNEEAEGHYRQALTILLEFGDRHGAAITYHQLGVVAQQQRRFEEAEGHYQQSLTIKLEFGNRHSTASTYHQLGRIAEEQRRFEEAEGHYQQSLTIKLEFGDRHSTALTYHQLGVVAQQQRRFEEAEGHYRQALTISLEFGDRHNAARTYHQLGMVAQEQRRFEEAEGHYRQALTIWLEFGDRHSAASTYHQLGVVAQLQLRNEEAADAYLNVAVAWHHTIGTWPTDTLQALKRISREVTADVFTAHITAIVPADLRSELANAIQEVGDN
ncbi:hypothetical protein GCM10009827_116890 [Dactylosporangium maewongense]|uniref:CHAT domain-containing protein n=1 Tax=Dactylosporangium maewongense TaxID=634393 RepID=A0ABN2DEL2_9ACTN